MRYVLFLESASWGIERERIFLNELLDVAPAIFKTNGTENTVITQCFDAIVNQLLSVLPNQQIISENELIIQNEFLTLLGISPKQQILIQDTLKFSLDLFEQGEKSIGFKRTLTSENKAYANIICDELNDFLQHSPLKVCATIYDVQSNDPLNLVVLSFRDTKEDVILKNAKDLTPALNELNKYSLQEKGQNIYVRKQFRYYDNDTIYLIQPNQKRFWTRAQAMDDAISLMVEIANMNQL
jgi:hypothetical protein